MSIDSSVVLGRGFILSKAEFNHIRDFFYKMDDPKLQEEWEDFNDEYIRPIDSYSCTEYFIGVMDDLGIEAGSYAPYPTKPSFDKSEIDDFIHDMLHLRLNKFIGKRTTETYILSLLY